MTVIRLGLLCAEGGQERSSARRGQPSFYWLATARRMTRPNRRPFYRNAVLPFRHKILAFGPETGGKTEESEHSMKRIIAAGMLCLLLRDRH